MQYHQMKYIPEEQDPSLIIETPNLVAKPVFRTFQNPIE